MIKNYNLELDFILDQLVLNYENQFLGIKFYSEESITTMKERISEMLKEKFGLKDWETDLLYHNLLTDKYIKSTESLTITIDGLIFRNNGGYIQKSINQNLEIERIKTLEKNTKQNGDALVLFTALLALGTLVSAWDFAIEIWKFYTGPTAP